MNDEGITRHFDAIRTILLPYKGNRNVDALPAALLFLLQAHAAFSESNSVTQAKILRDLDNVTEIVGKVGEIVTKEQFAKIKVHYAEIQHFASNKARGTHL